MLFFVTCGCELGAVGRELDLLDLFFALTSLRFFMCCVLTKATEG